MSSILEEFNDQKFQEFLESRQNGLVLFSAPWCAACKIITPIIEKIAKKKPSRYIKIDVSKNPGLASRLGVMSLPNIIIYKQGKVAGQLIGATSEKEIEKSIAFF